MKFKKEADKLYSKLEAEEVNGEVILYKKRKVYPVLKQDGSVNWFNFLTGGSYWKLIGVVVFIIIACGFLWEYHVNVQTGADCLSRENLARNISLSDLNYPEQLRLNPNWTKEEVLNEPQKRDNS